jgi:hypothetical protein
MSDEFLGDRRRALEDSFFMQKDRELLQRLRSHMAAEELAKECKVVEAPVLESLSKLGISSETLCAVVLVPLVEIAWSDRKVEASEREAVLKAVQDRGISPTSSAYKMVEHWLSQRPDEGLFEAWRAYASGLLERMTPAERAAFKSQLITNAQQVAEAAGGLLGYGRVSPSEHRVIDRLRGL